MDCCGHTCDMSKYFDSKKAKSEVRQYLNHGLPGHARAMLAAVSKHDLKGTTLLEVGGGIGALQIELLKRGVEEATNVEVSPASLVAASSLASQLGMADRIHQHQADFASQPDRVGPADVVILHRVVCCYPDMPRLVAGAANHAQRLLAMSFPRNEWYVRFFIELQAQWAGFRHSRFRNYVHSPEAIIRAATDEGLKLASQTFSGVWQIVVLERVDGYGG
jgi:predicted TPR repeat methyltransferase